MILKKIIVLLGLCLGAWALGAQVDTLQTIEPDWGDDVYDADTAFAEQLPAYVPPPAVKPRPVDEKIWEKAAGSLDYSADKPEPEPEKEMPEMDGPSLESWHMAAAWWGKVLQGLAIILAMAGIAYGIYRMLQAPKNSKVRRNDVSIESENLEEYLLENDLDVWLRDALASGNFALAVRIHFLQLIKKLAMSNHLTLSMEKTNRDYLRELRGHRDVETFRKLTLRYEEVWYGNRPMDKEAYDRLAAEFRTVS